MAVSHEFDPKSYLDTFYQKQSVYKEMMDFALVNVHNFFMQKYCSIPAF